MKQKYNTLLKNHNIKRWYDNVCRGSSITGDVYLRRLGNFCEKNKMTPEKLVKLGERKIYALLLDTVTEMEKSGYAGSYINSVLKSLKSWFSFNDLDIKKKIKVRGVNDTPSLKDERVPTQSELKRIFLAGDLKSRLASVLVAHGGLRIETLGNYEGNDGLRIKDFPELEIKGDTVEFKKIPTLVIVRSNLSKSRNQYFTFLSNEGCEYLKEYLEMRIRSGEKLTKESSVIRPKTAGKEFINTINIGDSIRNAIRKAGLLQRPYVLRSYFASALMFAESKALIIRDFRSFFMGHKGDIEATYTLRKKLSPDIVEEMRESYKKAQKYLQTIETEKDEEDIKKMFKKQLLLVAGLKPDEITEEFLQMEEEEFQKIVRERLAEKIENNNIKQRVVKVDEVDKFLSTGWQFVGLLPDNRVILKLS